MRAILQFNLPDEDYQFKKAVSGRQYHLALTELDRELRNWLKYGHDFKTADDAIEKMRDVLRENLTNGGLDDEAMPDYIRPSLCSQIRAYATRILAKIGKGSGVR